jgi:hypothetical protein
MADSNSTQPNQHNRRRSSVSVSELLAAHRTNMVTDTSPSVTARPNPAMTSGATQAAQQPHSRRLSITTLGLSGAGGSTPSAGGSGSVGRSNSILDAAGIRRIGDGGRARHASISEHENESAIMDDNDGISGSPNSAGIGRRMSLGAKAYGSLRSSGSGSSSGSGGLPTIPAGGTTGSPPAGHRMSRKSNEALFLPIHHLPALMISHTNSTTEGYNFQDTIYQRTQQRYSESGNRPPQLPTMPNGPTPAPATMSQPVQPQPPPAPVAPPKKEVYKLDETQERILRGDLYRMD